jgi:hypothetical protein
MAWTVSVMCSRPWCRARARQFFKCAMPLSTRMRREQCASRWRSCISSYQAGGVLLELAMRWRHHTPSGLRAQSLIAGPLEGAPYSLTNSVRRRSRPVRRGPGLHSRLRDCTVGSSLRTPPGVRCRSPLLAVLRHQEGILPDVRCSRRSTPQVGQEHPDVACRFGMVQVVARLLVMAVHSRGPVISPPLRSTGE